MQQNVKTFQIKQNDTFPSLEVSVKSRGCLDSVIPFNLSGVTACTFSMADDCGNLKISSMPAMISSYSGGCVQYDWVIGDTDTPGKFKAEFELFFSDGKKTTIPTLGAIEVNVLKSVNDI
jgi:hypothetical protein